MEFGLTDQQLNEIIGIVSQYTEIQEAIIFGSRADGTNKNASDVDIVIKSNNAKFEYIGRLLSDSEESNLPFFVDVVDYYSVNSEILRKHIDLYGVIFYKKKVTNLDK